MFIACCDGCVSEVEDWVEWNGLGWRGVGRGGCDEGWAAMELLGLYSAALDCVEGGNVLDARVRWVHGG